MCPTSCQLQNSYPGNSKSEHSFSLLLLNYVNGNDSANKVHDNKVQDGAGKEKISKGSLWGDALEVRFVLWVDLYSQANR